MRCTLAIMAAVSVAADVAATATGVLPAPAPYVQLGGSPLILMPSINLGTCCGSDPTVGLTPWLKAGGRGIDSAYDYQDQLNISAVLAAADPLVARSEIFILSKVSPDGMGSTPGHPFTPSAGRGSDAACEAGAAGALAQVYEDLRELNTTYLDVVLLHWPCGVRTGTDMRPEKLAQNSALWAGLVEAQLRGLTRAIGVSSYNSSHLAALKGPKPALNQCHMSPKEHDNATIAYCLREGIAYEAFGVMRGCPFSDKALGAIATKHSVSVAQVCVRWVLQRGCIAALGTGDDTTKVDEYTKENLGVWGFNLTDSEMAIINTIQHRDA
eukprot:SAG11_NODE_5187_length_1636_cov_1.497723_2_plen_326_part_01